jgi:hypothetical protein
MPWANLVRAVGADFCEQSSELPICTDKSVYSDATPQAREWVNCRDGKLIDN